MCFMTASLINFATVMKRYCWLCGRFMWEELWNLVEVLCPDKLNHYPVNSIVGERIRHAAWSRVLFCFYVFHALFSSLKFPSNENICGVILSLNQPADTRERRRQREKTSSVGTDFFERGENMQLVRIALWYKTWLERSMKCQPHNIYNISCFACCHEFCHTTSIFSFLST